MLPGGKALADDGKPVLRVFPFEVPAHVEHRVRTDEYGLVLERVYALAHVHVFVILELPRLPEVPLALARDVFDRVILLDLVGSAHLLYEYEFTEILPRARDIRACEKKKQ